MLITCEGVDGGGKSTLVQTLIKTHGFLTEDEPHIPSVLRLTKGQPTPGVDAFEEYELPLEAADVLRLIHSSTDLVVMDRWHAGEMIYGELYRGHSRLTDAGMLHVEMLLDALGALKLLVQPSDPHVVRTRLEERGEDFLRMEHLETVHAWYERHAVKYGYVRASTLSPSMMLARAGHISVSNSDDGDLRHLPGYVGTGTPRVLLVGDQRNDGPRARLEFPRAFTPWDRAGSALYLMNALVLNDMRQGVGMVNAHEPGVDVSHLRDLPYQVNVVALGARAAHALDDAKVKHEAVAHPQWWKRFRHGKITAYAEELRKAARWS